MSAKHFIPLLALLAAFCVWNVSQRRSIQSLEIKNRVLRQQIRAAGDRDPSATSSPPHARGAGQGFSSGERPFDWEKLSIRMMENRGSAAAPELAALADRLAQMSQQDLSASLDQISTLGLEAEAKSLLEANLLEAWIKKDPESALKRFASRISPESGDDDVTLQLPAALRGWARQDPTAAAAWLDRQIAIGLFQSRSLDGDSDVRTEFEAALAGILLSTDSTAAVVRLSGLSDDQRRDVLDQTDFSELNAHGRIAYVDLIRGLLRDNESAATFSNIVPELISEGGYAQVSAFLDEIHASPGERELSATQAVSARLEEISATRTVTRQDFELMRRWLDQQAPGTASQVAGTVLAEMAGTGGESGFADAARLVLDLQPDGRDEALAAFLESDAAHSNLAKALQLAGHITDGKRREAVIRNLKANASPP